MTPFAARVHKLTNEGLADCPAWEAVSGQVRAMLGGAWICGHHASVEYQVLTRHLPGWRPAGVLDTLRLARAAYTDAPKHNLDALIEYARLDLTGAPAHRHRATFDAYATALLLLRMADQYDTWEALVKAVVPPGLPGAPQPEQEPTLVTHSRPTCGGRRSRAGGRRENDEIHTDGAAAHPRPRYRRDHER